jgi:hypothetical protein
MTIVFRKFLLVSFCFERGFLTFSFRVDRIHILTKFSFTLDGKVHSLGNAFLIGGRVVACRATCSIWEVEQQTSAKATAGRALVEGVGGEEGCG